MIKLTILQLMNAGLAMQKLAPQKLTGVATLRIKRLAAKLEPELRVAIDARDTLLTPENSIEGHGGSRQIKPACLAAFLAAPLFGETITVDILPLLPADIAEARLSGEDLDLLGPLFVDDGQ